MSATRVSSATHQHSPGPWAAFWNERNKRTGIGDWFFFAGETSKHVRLRSVRASDPVALADARLVAAAPELLEALKEAIETCSFMDAATDDERLTDGDCLNRWKAAVAKAEGR